MQKNEIRIIKYYGKMNMVITLDPNMSKVFLRLRVPSTGERTPACYVVYLYIFYHNATSVARFSSCSCHHLFLILRSGNVAVNMIVRYKQRCMI